MQAVRGNDALAERDDFLQDRIGGFQNNDFFAGDERQDGIRCFLDELDEVRIDHQRLVVETSQLNHVGSLWRRWEHATHHKGASLEVSAGLGSSSGLSAKKISKVDWTSLIGKRRARFPQGMD